MSAPFLFRGSDTIRAGVGQAIAAVICIGLYRCSLSGEESPGSTGQGAR